MPRNTEPSIYAPRMHVSPPKRKTWACVSQAIHTSFTYLTLQCHCKYINVDTTREKCGKWLKRCRHNKCQGCVEGGTGGTMNRAKDKGTTQRSTQSSQADDPPPSYEEACGGKVMEEGKDEKEEK